MRQQRGSEKCQRNENLTYQLAKVGVKNLKF